MWTTESGRGWVLAGGGAVRVDVDDRDDNDDGGTRTRDFERVAIAAGESGNNEDPVHAKSSTSDARVTCSLSRRHQDQQLAVVVVHRDGKAKKVVSQTSRSQEEGAPW